MALIRAIDGGGTGFRRADIDGIKIRSYASEGNISSLNDLLAFVKGNLLPGTAGIAYAIAGVIEERRRIVTSPNAHFLDGLDLGLLTNVETGLPTLVFNDMEAAVAGMATLLPSAYDHSYFLGITWSSGIGLRVWKNGKILSVAEGGHMVIDPSLWAPLCGCGKRGHAEAIIGGKAITRRVLMETEALGITLPKDIDPFAFLDECYFLRQEHWAADIYQNVIYRGMGIFLANLQSLLHLPLIVWKGTVARQVLKQTRVKDHLRLQMQKHLIDPSWASEENLRFLLSPDPENDSLIGAAHAFMALP